ncbi:hypothetical protein CYMTET_8335 [Cymbomonas tetramitiformis]|uniref:Uncharacterized protein n=1 Tax=Cymbomonas tetramitiformis TaxID=36881 RepID=A0AAE0GTQ5_9CHLO|nr:hypothetical protein CYMTET_8335 [Cymbomonas tetramitiformis]
MAADLAHVPLASLRSMVVEIYQAWAQTDTGKAASGADGISAHLSSSEYDALLVKITELKELVQRQHGEGAPMVRQQRVQQRQQQQQRAQQPKGYRMGQQKARIPTGDTDELPISRSPDANDVQSRTFTATPPTRHRMACWDAKSEALSRT